VAAQPDRKAQEKAEAAAKAAEKNRLKELEKEKKAQAKAEKDRLEKEKAAAKAKDAEAARAKAEKQPKPEKAATPVVAESKKAKPGKPGKTVINPFEGIQSPVAPVSADKQKQLDELLALYKKDQITPSEYHQRRAKIMTDK
jgi:hypothetical protein